MFYLQFSLSILLQILLSSRIIYSAVNNIDCKDTNLSIYCICQYDDSQNSTKLNCSSLLMNETNKLPDIATDTVIAQRVFSLWPAIPVSYLNTTNLDLSYGTIASVTNLTYLMNLRRLILKNNNILTITADICKLNSLNFLDLSNNALTNFSFELMLCEPANYSSIGFLSNLKKLILSNNSIKAINSLDLIFFAFPSLSLLSLKSNPIADITISSLSNKTVKIISELKRGLNYFPNYFYPISAFYLDLTGCALTHIKLNLSMIFSNLIQLNNAYQPWIDAILLKFQSIDFYGNNVTCDCDVINDYGYVLNDNNFFNSIYFNNITNSSFGQNTCHLNNRSFNIMNLVKCNLKNIFFNISYYIQINFK